MRQIFDRFLRGIGLCVIICVYLSAAVALLLRTPLWEEQKAYIFRLFALEIFSCLPLVVVSVWVVIKNRTICGMDITDMVVCVALSGMFMATFFTVVVMPIERSYTIFTLADMADHQNKVYSYAEIKDKFITGFVEEANETQKRIDEQVYIGDLAEIDGEYRITSRGKNLIRLYRMIEAVFPVPDSTCIYPNGR